VIRLIVDAASPGMLGGTLRIVTDRDDEPVPLAYGGIIISHDTIIRQLVPGASSIPSDPPPTRPAPGGIQ
jgi:hypothetical protein